MAEKLLRSTLARMTEQHEEFLVQAQSSTVQLLLAENERLTAELALARRAASSSPAMPPVQPSANPPIMFLEATDHPHEDGDSSSAKCEPTCLRLAAGTQDGETESNPDIPPPAGLPGALPDACENARVGFLKSEGSNDTGDSVSKTVRRSSTSRIRFKGRQSTTFRVSETGGFEVIQTTGDDNSMQPNVVQMTTYVNRTMRSMMIDHQEDQLYSERRRKTLHRLRMILGLSYHDTSVSRDKLTAVIMKRMDHGVTYIDEEAIGQAIDEMYHINEIICEEMGGERGMQDAFLSTGPETAAPHRVSHNSGVSEHSVPLDVLAAVLSLSDPSIFCSTEPLKSTMGKVCRTLVQVTVEEAIQEATGDTPIDDSWNVDGSPIWETVLNAVVIFVLFVNLLAVGISVDHSQGTAGWAILETVCCLVFVCESIMKITLWGPMRYFRGELALWNMFDLVITTVGAIDVLIMLIDFFIDRGDGLARGGFLKVTVAFRAIRVLRVVHLLKIVNSSYLKDLANMVAGFIIGAPSLFWLLVMFAGILYMTGVCFRMALGPSTFSEISEIEEMLERCISGDALAFAEPSDHCDAALLYGLEFFGDMRRSVFTAFRFMLGDYTSAGGRNLVVTLSSQHGILFDLLFMCWMIVVIFGAFNIISAIFVDATITGLKHNEVKKKYVRQYERRFVQQKLTEMVQRVEHIIASKSGTPSTAHFRRIRSKSGINFGCKIYSQSLRLKKNDFIEVMDDEIIRAILQDLDVVMHNADDLFDTFDPDRNGHVTGPELVEAIVKLRGEPQKNDLVAMWRLLRKLHEKVDEMQVLMHRRARSKTVLVEST